MTINIKYGFEYKNVKFGWFEKELYRLPFTTNNKHYGIKKLQKINLSKTTIGYRCMRDKLSLKIIQDLTKTVNWTTELNILKDEEHLPF